MWKCEECNNGKEYKEAHRQRHYKTKLHQASLKKPWFCHECRDEINYKVEGRKEYCLSDKHMAIMNGEIGVLHREKIKELDRIALELDKYWLKCGPFILSGGKLSRDQMIRYRGLSEPGYRAPPQRDMSEYYCYRCKMFKVKPNDDFYVCLGCKTMNSFLV